jgi:hypothetical protein
MVAQQPRMPARIDSLTLSTTRTRRRRASCLRRNRHCRRGKPESARRPGPSSRRARADHGVVVRCASPKPPRPVGRRRRVSLGRRYACRRDRHRFASDRIGRHAGARAVIPAGGGAGRDEAPACPPAAVSRQTISLRRSAMTGSRTLSPQTMSTTRSTMRLVATIWSGRRIAAARPATSVNILTKPRNSRPDRSRSTPNIDVSSSVSKTASSVPTVDTSTSPGTQTQGDNVRRSIVKPASSIK